MRTPAVGQLASVTALVGDASDLWTFEALAQRDPRRPDRTFDARRDFLHCRLGLPVPCGEPVLEWVRSGETTNDTE